jgi:ribosomal protein S27E
MAPAQPPQTAPLSYVLGCPHCGAPSEVEADARSFVCDHCRSFLAVHHPGRDEIFLGESQVPDAAAVREVVILYRVQSQRAEVVARWGTLEQDGTRTPPPESFIQGRLREYEQRLREVVRVVDAQRLQAPYWHVTGSIVQAALGRVRDGPKEVRLRAFLVEHTVPAYDTRRYNLRDRGLRLSGSRVRPLRRREMGAEGPYLPWADAPERTHQEIRRWEGRDLIPGFEAVTKRGRFCFGRRILVYRPLWLARVLSDTGQSLVLVDAGFGTIGGYPSEAEGVELLRGAVSDPEGPESRETRAVVVKSRCPDCGFEAAFDRRAVIVACPNCHRGLELDAKGIRLVSVGHVPGDLDSTWLPFWAFPFRLRVGAALHDTLEAWARALHARGLPPGFHPRGRHLYVPACRLLGTEVGDTAFRELVQWLHAAGLALEPHKPPLGGRPEFVAATLPAEHARELLPWVLWAMSGKSSAARLNTLTLKRAIESAQLEASEARLFYLPFRRAGAELSVPGGPVVPRLVVDGGPALDAQRATVAHALS